MQGQRPRLPSPPLAARPRRRRPRSDRARPARRHGDGQGHLDVARVPGAGAARAGRRGSDGDARMNATEYTIDPKNEVAIRFLQSRPIQIGQTGFLVSVAQDLENRGSLSKGQREAIERIAAKSNWQPGPALPPTVDDRGTELKIYCTPGHPIPKDFFKALGDRYRGSGLTGAVVVHDPVYMIMLDPAAMPLDAPYRL